MSDALGPHTTLNVVQPPSLCNLNCTYCCVPNRRDATRMSVSTLERLFERVFSSPFVHDEIEILWHAGEPMAVGPDFYRQAMRTIELLNHKNLVEPHTLLSSVNYFFVRAQRGLCLHHNYQQQVPWANPALPLGKPLPPLNPTSLATKTEQRRTHP